MAGANGTHGFATGLLLALALLVAAPPGVTHAADEPTTQILPGDAHAASVLDLDGDGVNELVRIVADEASGHVAEAWQAGAEGWTLLGAASIPRLDAAGVEQGVLRGIDTSATLLWHLDGRARVLVLARWGPRSIDAGEVECCFSMFELVWRSGAITLEPRTAEGGGADLVHAFDADADGTDELLLNGFFRPDSLGEVEVLRWDGDGFRSVFLEADAEGVGNVFVAECDGFEGDDIIIGPSASGALRRIAWVEGEFRAEDGPVELAGRDGPFVSGIAGGALVLTLPAQLQIVRWPRGETPITEARLPRGDWPYAGIVGTGPDTLLVVQDAIVGPSSAPGATVYDLELRELGRITIPAATERLAAIFNDPATGNRGWQRYLYPYSGPLPGAGARIDAGFVWNGVLVQTGGDEGFEASSIAPMAGLWPIGLAGPGDGWMALNSGYLYPGGPAALFSGMLPPGYGRTSMVPIDDLLRADGSAATVELQGAVAVDEAAEGLTSLVADGDGFAVAVTAPAGTWVTAWDGQSLDELTVEGPPLVLEFAAPRRGKPDEDQPIEAWLIVATPDGRASLHQWDGTFVRQPPELNVTGRTDVGSLSATLEGTVGPHVSVAVDGVPVAVDAQGRFRTSVSVPIWPGGVEVVARDLVGNESVDRIEVVGLYDYRGLPWAAIVTVATVSVGAVLFVRTPRRRKVATDDGGDDGQLEEMEPIDGSEVLRP